MTSGQILVEATGITKSFGSVSVLHGVDLKVHAGQVLALLGENGAGKSTLVKVLAGDHRPDSGTITCGIREYDGLDPITAASHGIRMIFQELNDAGRLSVAENIVLGRWTTKNRFISWKTVRKQAQDALDQLDANLDLDRPVDTLRVGERQLVEIARALSADAKVLILDEPTAALSSTETDRLFGTIEKMNSRGVGMIYITHRLDEVTAIADRVQVLRDGECALDEAVSDVTRSDMVAAMIGRSASNVQRPQHSAATNTTALSLAGYSLEGAFADISLNLHRGEVVALYGKVGSGTAEVAESIFGLHNNVSGTMELNGKVHQPRDPHYAVKHGIGYLPPDRQRSGSLNVRSVAENLAAPSWWRMSTAGWVRGRDEATAYLAWRDALSIRSRKDPRQKISTLSGGNQQKVLLGRWLERDVATLILVEPTRGVDVGAREDIYASIRLMAVDRGLAVLVVTSDYEEVVQLSDRALVMRKGRLVEALSGADVTLSKLTAAAGG